MWQYRVRNLFSILIICLSFLTLGIFLALSNNLQQTARELSKNLVAVFFLENEVTEEAQTSIKTQLQNSPLITEVRFVSSPQALDKFQDKFPDLMDIIDNLDKNPLPPSFEVTFKDENLSPNEISLFIDEMRQVEGVSDVQFNQEWVDRMFSLSRLARAVGFFLGGILVLASFFIISNIIKLNVFSRQDEIEILRLSGASNNFIRIPFLLEGMILGVLGGALSLLLLFILIKIFPLYIGSSLGVLDELFKFRYLTLIQCLVLVLSCALIGFFGSLSSLSRFLRV
jgi:cell division transport system permease protein